MERVHRYKSNDAHYTPRRAPIPRPWLKQEKFSGNDLDILGEPRWQFSLNKLSTCCCGKKSEENKMTRNAPFPDFPLIRRDSSHSFNSYELYSSDGSGSVSDFTDSDTSSSYSSSRNEPTRRPLVEQSTPPTLASKPPMINPATRSTSLPPLNPNPVWATPTPPVPRRRCDTGEFTKTSHTSNTSRHRRLKKFAFSPQSLTDIWNDTGPIRVKAPSQMPPLEVQFPDDNDYLRLNGSFTSSFDDSYDGFEAFSAWNDTPTNDSLVAGERRQQADDLQRFPLPMPPRPSTDRPHRSKGRKKKTKPTMSTPVYLRKKDSLDDVITGHLVLSGWIAASLDDDTFESRLKAPSSKISMRNVHYMQIVEENMTASVILYNTAGTVAHSLVLERDWRCESQEITNRIGKFVTVRSPASTIVRLLPISLDDSFFNEENMVPSKQFAQLQNKLFASGVYAPDEQHDTATYILFSLDALIKKCGK